MLEKKKEDEFGAFFFTKFLQIWLLNGEIIGGPWREDEEAFCHGPTALKMVFW